jgi:hypothetical protein
MAEQFAIVRWDDDREEEAYGAAFIHTPHLASVLIDECVYDDASALDAAMQRTFQVCLQLQVPIRQHFQPVHVHDMSGHIQDDWALSDLAFYLLLLNGNARNEAVAYAQAYAVRHVFS